MHKNSY